ncbi:MAG: sulfur carrier protein ThiS [Planctomycetota bacterium]|jgi:thiamine biosynthesis protein ThiS
MRITVNGDEIAVDEPCSVTRLLARLDLAGRPCAVEVNRQLVPKRDHGDRSLVDGDQVEIVTLVGGG